MLTALGARVEAWIARNEPWTNVYGLARTLLALATAATLMVTPMTALFHPLAGISGSPPYCHNAIQRAGFFCLLSASHIQWMRWGAVAVLLIVASGWRPRFTAIPHWWIAVSLNASGALIEGGEQVVTGLTLLLLPVALTDPRKWHWDPPPPRTRTFGDDAGRTLASLAYLLVRLQVAIIYFHACVGKLAVDEWTDGTALYYWLLHPTFGAPGWLEPAVRAVVTNGTAVTLLTWTVIVVEYLLSAALFMRRDRWFIPLIAGFALHAGIILIHGLVSFGTIMFAALILYLRPWERPFAIPRRAGRIGNPDVKAAAT